MKPSIACAACAGLLALPGAALADEWEQQVQAKIQTIEADLSGSGWDMDRSAYMSRLAQDETGFLTMRLSDYARYKLVAVGDRDCSDLDLYIYDAEDNLVGQNVDPADIVDVEVEPQATGEYRLVVHMDDCLSEPCRFGVAVFSD